MTSRVVCPQIGHVSRTDRSAISLARAASPASQRRPRRAASLRRSCTVPAASIPNRCCPLSLATETTNPENYPETIERAGIPSTPMRRFDIHALFPSRADLRAPRQPKSSQRPVGHEIPRRREFVKVGTGRGTKKESAKSDRHRRSRQERHERRPFVDPISPT